MSGHRVAATAFAAVCAFTFAAAMLPAHAQSIDSADNCMQAITDAQEAHDSNPAISEQDEQTFQQLLAQARQHCDAQEFADAEQAINTAKGMVASE